MYLMYVEHLDGPEFPKSLGRFSQTIRYVKGGADTAEASEELAVPLARLQRTSRGLSKRARARRLNWVFLTKIHTQKIANMSEQIHQALVSLLDASLQQVFPSAVSLRLLPVTFA